MLLVGETRSEILAAAVAGEDAAFDADGRSKIMAVDDWMSEARRRGEITAEQHWSVLEPLAELPTFSECPSGNRLSHLNRL